MPTREEALTELANVFRLIADEYAGRNQPLPIQPEGDSCVKLLFLFIYVGARRVNGFLAVQSPNFL